MKSIPKKWIFGEVSCPPKQPTHVSPPLAGAFLWLHGTGSAWVSAAFAVYSEKKWCQTSQQVMEFRGFSLFSVLDGL